MGGMDRRVFLGWDRPLLEALVDWLRERRDEMPGMLVVVPTAQSGRRLREALAENGACLAPRVVTPGFFVPRGADVASRIELLYAWTEVLRSTPQRETLHLFPVEPPDRSFRWATMVAKEIEATRGQLADEGMNLADVARAGGEKDRWLELAKLEAAMRGRLEHWERADPLVAAEPVGLPPGVDQLVVAGVAEATRPALSAWEGLERVTVLVHAPEEERDAFDEWGQPLEAWAERSSPVALDRIHVTGSPPELAAKVVGCLDGVSSDRAGVGLCDDSFGPALEAAFGEAGWPAWNPEGRSAARSMILMLKDFGALAVRGQRWEAAVSILRNPLLERILGAEGIHAALWALDDIETRHLPDNLETVKIRCGGEEAGEGRKRLAEAIAWLEKWRDRFVAGNCAAAVREWIAEMRRLEVPDGADGRLYEGLEAAAEPVATLESRGAMAGPGEAVEAMVDEVSSLRYAAGRESAVIDLSGWLELPYEPAERLVLAGMHEGRVPEGAGDDPFLNDRLRGELGMRTARDRLARDMFLLHSLAASRHVEVVIAKVDAAAEPRRPSRLLLVAEGGELAERVRKLFGEPAGAAARLAGWDRGGWKLEFDDPVAAYLDGERKLSPTALSNYLFCPFRFYLKRVLKWERHDAGKLEMDALDFGNLCHHALQAMVEQLPDEEEEAALCDFLWEQVDAGLRSAYGGVLPVPLLVQREAARSRLARFADIEVGQRRLGWRTRHAELKVGDEGREWQIDGQPVSMQIDRIDFHPEHGWRVLDYKTSAKAKPPREAHLVGMNPTRRVFGPEVPGSRGGVKVWGNVQLPLYAAFVKEWQGLEELPQVGYVNLPVTLNDVGFSMWREFDEGLCEGALECARGAIGALREKVHWPPVVLKSDQKNWDDFAELAPDGLAEAVGGATVEELQDLVTGWEGGAA